MRRNIFHNKGFKKLLFISLLAFILLWSALLMSFSQILHTSIREKENQRNQTISVDVSRQLDSIASAVTILQKNIYQSDWINKLMSGSFTSIFTSYSKLQHCNELQKLISNTPSVARVALLFPELNTAVTNSSWTDIDDCIKSFWSNHTLDISPIIKNITGPYPIDNKTELQQHYFINGYMLILQKLEMASSSRGYALYTIPMARFYESLAVYTSGKMESSFAGMSLLFYHEKQYHIGYSEYIPEYNNDATLKEGLVAVERISRFPGVSYRFFFSKGMLTEDKMQIASATLLFALFLLIGAGLVFYLVFVMYIPFDKLFSKLQSKGGANAEQISTVEGAAQAFDGMIEENAKMHNLTEQYRLAARNSFLLRMMKGDFVQREDSQSFLKTISELEIPFYGDNHFRVLLITIPENSFEHNVEISGFTSKTKNMLANEGVQSAIAEISHHEFAFILAFSAESTDSSKTQWTNEAVLYIDDFITNIVGVKAAIGIGSIFGGLAGISESYNQIMLEAPTYNAVADEGEQGLQEAQQVQYNILLGQQLVEYVEQHYSNCEISLKMLSEKFSASPSAVSRSFKRTAGVNFLEYLIRLRMEHAKQMLTNKEGSLRSIALAVGYENDYSFRRAFERYEGMRLQDFRRGNSGHS